MDCLFCGEDCRPTREHVIARWVRNVLGSGVGHVRRQTTTEEAHTDGSFDGPVFEQTVREVCEACNNGWSHDLEETVRPFLTQMLRGEPQQLDALQQERLAVWAQKTGLLLARTAPNNEQLTDLDTYRWLGRHQMPLSGSIVWIGARDLAQAQWSSISHQYGFDQMRHGVKRGEGLSFVLGLGRVVFLVYAQSLAPSAAVGKSDDRLTVIWPLTGDTIRWPPGGGPWNDEELNELAKTQPAGIEKRLPPQLADPSLLGTRS